MRNLQQKAQRINEFAVSVTKLVSTLKAKMCEKTDTVH